MSLPRIRVPASFSSAASLRISGRPALQEPSWPVLRTSPQGLQPMTCGVCLPRDPKTFSPEYLPCLVHKVLYEGRGTQMGTPIL